MKVKGMKYTIVLICISSMLCCGRRNTSFVIDHPQDGIILIDGNEIEDYVIESYTDSATGGLLVFLNISRGDHTISLLPNSGDQIDTTVYFRGDENYYSIDLKEGVIRD